MTSPSVKIERRSTPPQDESISIPATLTPPQRAGTDDLEQKGTSDPVQKRGKESKTKQNSAKNENSHQTKLSGPVETLEMQTNVSAIYLKCLRDEFAKHVLVFPEFEKWIEDIDDLLHRKATPKIFVGLIGRTGAGKSTAINSLLDQRIHCCSSMGAGTSFVTITSYNSDNDPDRRYRASIETLSKEEWSAELAVLLSDLKDVPLGESVAASSHSDAGLAMAKIKALHPDLDLEDLKNMSVNQLLVVPGIRNVLGTRVEFAGSSWRKVKMQIHKFTNSRTTGIGASRKPAYWPLVKEQHNFLKLDWLKHGIHICDLPGIGDSNAARAAIAGKYMRNLDKFWIVWSIERAMNDASAVDLLDQSVKLRAQGTGKLDADYFSFILTRTDQIMNDDVIEELSLHDLSDLKTEQTKQHTGNVELRKLAKDIQSLKANEAKNTKKIKQLERKITLAAKEAQSQSLINDQRDSQPQAISPTPTPLVGVKRKAEILDELDEPKSQSIFPYSSEAAQMVEEKSQLKQETSTLAIERTKKQKDYDLLKTNLKKSSFRLTAICIQERNRHVSECVRNQFAQELNNLENCFEEHNEKQPSVQKSPEKHLAGDLSVFCISSIAYDQQHHRNKIADPISGFYDEESTGIPQLREHAINSSLPARRAAAESLLIEQETMTRKFVEWAEDDSPQTWISKTQKLQMEELIESHIELLNQEVRKKIDACTAQVETIITERLGPVLCKATSKAIRKLPGILDKWFIKDDTAFVHYASLRACAKREGEPYVTGKKMRIHLNERIADSLIAGLSYEWGFYTTHIINRTSEVFLQDTKTEMDKFQDSFAGAIDKMSPEMTFQVAPLLTQLTLDFNTKFKDAVQGCYRRLQNDAAECLDLPCKVAKNSMSIAYETIAAKTGRGSSHANEATMKSHGSEYGQVLYENSVDAMRTKYKSSFEVFRASLGTAFENSVVLNLRKCLQISLNYAVHARISDRPSARKVEIQSMILKYNQELPDALSNFDGTVKFANYKVPEQPVGAKKEKSKSKEVDMEATDSEGDSDDDDEENESDDGTMSIPPEAEGDWPC